MLQNKHFARPAVFQPENLLRETRRQKSLPSGSVPTVCVLDPDGDIVAHLLQNNQAERDPVWACYHTSLYRFERGGMTFGIIGCAVGGPFAVLLAEQLFVSGCELLDQHHVGWADCPRPDAALFRAHRKGAAGRRRRATITLPPAKYVSPAPGRRRASRRRFETSSLRRWSVAQLGRPTRPTGKRRKPSKFARAEGVLAVEMEAASLYAFAQAKQKPVVCFAHITNRMGVSEGDFEKGEADGTVASLRLIEAVAQRWRNRPA